MRKRKVRKKVWFREVAADFRKSSRAWTCGGKDSEGLEDINIRNFRDREGGGILNFEKGGRRQF